MVRKDNNLHKLLYPYGFPYKIESSEDVKRHVKTLLSDVDKTLELLEKDKDVINEELEFFKLNFEEIDLVNVVPVYFGLKVLEYQSNKVFRKVELFADSFKHYIRHNKISNANPDELLHLSYSVRQYYNSLDGHLTELRKLRNTLSLYLDWEGNQIIGVFKPLLKI